MNGVVRCGSSLPAISVLAVVSPATLSRVNSTLHARTLPRHGPGHDACIVVSRHRMKGESLCRLTAFTRILRPGKKCLQTFCGKPTNRARVMTWPGQLQDQWK